MRICRPFSTSICVSLAVVARGRDHVLRERAPGRLVDRAGPRRALVPSGKRRRCRELRAERRRRGGDVDMELREPRAEGDDIRAGRSVRERPGAGRERRAATEPPPAGPGGRKRPVPASGRPPCARSALRARPRGRARKTMTVTCRGFAGLAWMTIGAPDERCRRRRLDPSAPARTIIRSAGERALSHPRPQHPLPGEDRALNRPPVRSRRAILVQLRRRASQSHAAPAGPTSAPRRSPGARTRLPRARSSARAPAPPHRIVPVPVRQCVHDL